MKIRTKLSLQFTAIVTSLLGISLIAIYSFSSFYREMQFYDRLEERANRGIVLFKQAFIEDSIDLKLLSDLKLGSLINEHITIYDFDKNIIFTNSKNNIIEINQIILDELYNDGKMRFDYGKSEFYAKQFHHNNQHFIYFTGAEDRFGKHKLINLQVILTVVFLLISVFAILSGRFFASRALKPIVKIIDEVSEISATNLNKRVDTGKGNDEIAVLAKTFNLMLEKLEKSFKMQENFVSNASHEIRTPLTLIKGQLEIILQKDRNPEYYKNKLNSMLDDIKKLNDISNQLILLANVCKDESNFRFEPVRIDEIIWQLRSDYENKSNLNKIDFAIGRLPDDDKKLTILGNEILLKSAFSNIIDNAIKYSDNALVTIKLNIFEEHINIIITDKGIGIPQKDINNIFQAFYRAENVMQIPGSGIGLSIVSRILEIHNAEIKVKTKINHGTSFIMKFPN